MNGKERFVSSWVPTANDLYTRYGSVLFLSVACLLSLVMLAKCGKDSSTQPGTPGQPTPPPTSPPPTSPPPPTTSQPARIDVSPSSANFTAVGQTVQFMATVFDNNDALLTSAAVSWSSDDTEVVTVSAQGLATAMGNGMATITARSGNVSRDASVSVLDVSAQRQALITIGRALKVVLPGWGSALPLNEWLGVRTNTLGQVTGLELIRGMNLGTRKPIPPEIGQLTQLEELKLYNSYVFGPLPQTMTRLANLKMLDLEFTKVCVPPTSAFQAWLNGIPEKTGVSTICGANPDRDALIALYNETGGPGWSKNANWLSDLPLSTWYGVQTNFEEEVTLLELSENNLQGEIPSEIGQLQKLTYLSFHNNQLIGEIPSEIGQLMLLTVLRLSNNQLTGKIPIEIGQLQILGDLSFHNNQLTGNIPSEIGQLRELKNLELGNNRLSGKTPTEIGQLQNLTHLHLNNNQLTGEIPSEIGQLRELTVLGLGNNKLTGNLPDRIGQLSKLMYLILEDNPGLSGNLPEAIIALANLETLYLHNTQICIPHTSQYVTWFNGIPYRTGGPRCPSPQRDALIALFDQTDGPNWTDSTNWKSLEPLDRWRGITVDGEGQVTELILENNNMIGAVPGQLGDLSKLKTLDLSFNAGLTGTIPVSVSRLNLETLNLDGTQVCAPPAAEIQQWLTEISRLTVANCTDIRPDYYVLTRLYHATNGKSWTNSTNWLSDAPLDTWFGVRSNSSEEVTELDLKENNLVGAIPFEIGQLKNLTLLDLGLNQLTGNVPPEISGLADITHLYLHANRLTGNIPSEIGQLRNLRELRLDQNRFAGSIPPEIGDLQELGHIWLNGNQLTGVIPSEIGQLHKLTNLDLSANRLTGEIPPEIWRLQRLRALVIRGDGYNQNTGNRLTGVIPPTIAQLENLEYLDLEYNRFTGEIPPEIGDLHGLLGLGLGGNQLSGTIPTEICRLQKLTDLDLSGNRLSGDIPSEIGQLTNLRVLDLSRNELEGTIPHEIGRLAFLKLLTLSDNRLTGFLPQEFADLGMLEVLHVSFNELSGRIPGSFGDLDNLRVLGLTGNVSMSGTLPLTLINLNLDDLLLGGTNLCAPETAEFQDWLRAVPNSRILRCDIDTVRSAAYLTQAVQSLDYPVPLVAGEDALLRVFVTSEAEMDANMPLVRATFYDGGAEVYTVDIPSQEIPIPTEVDEGDLASSANARIPGSVLASGLEMVIELDPDGASALSSDIESRLPSEGRLAVDVRDMPPFDLTMVPFLWTENPDRTIVALVQGLTADSDHFRLTRDILPVGEFNLTIREPVWTSVEPAPHNFGSTFNETAVIHAVDGAVGHYMGILTGEGTGLADAPGFISVSTLDPTVITHELGHNMSLFHAPCTIGTFDPFLDPEFPYPVSAVGTWGYDLLNEMLVHPDTMDVMGCGDWISDYFFTKALGYRLYREKEPLPVAPYGTPGRSLLLWGGVSSDGELLLEPSFVVDAPPSLPDMNGPYLLTGMDDGGQTLFRLSFDLAEIADGSGEKTFAFIIPARATWSNRLTEITLAGPEGFSMLGGEEGLADQEAPAASLLLDPVTGTVRGILRDWPDQDVSTFSARRLLPETGLDIVISTGVPESDDWQW